ncbi:hypothetical protein [Streptomyces sp. TSRI0107]|uniref:hypothetical protein n=2 Tax=unclassified Streptomyces TaxID=2593676 RepID=UPI000959676C|nr:hypothetical protein [Streptomyces sp. TSRI0107]OKJ87588.1 hypothetical protein AMK31_10500 [Streptomyces sp. TSRI0107]
MSRETDSPSSGPNGRGGAAYPSGTPPYGTPTVSDGGADGGRSAAQPEERKTETTLTTRIRINIPGSRPIPPVVVRKPVADAESAAADDTEAEAPAPSAATATGTVEPPAEPAPQAEEKTSDWFAPRKSAQAKGGQGGPAANGASAPGGSGAPGAAPAGGARPAAGSGRPGGVVGSVNAPGGSRPGGTNGSGLPGATGGPVAPGHGGGTGSFDVTEALAAGPLGSGSRTGETRRDDLPYFSENAQNGQASRNGQSSQGTQNGQNGQAGYGGPRGGGPSGPTSGPVTGDGPVVPPTAFTAPNPLAGAPAPGGGLSDDTAILTPQKQVPEPPAGASFTAPHDNVSGHTVTSGIPVVPSPDHDAGFPPARSGAAPAAPKPPAPAVPAQQSAPAAAPRKKKGRNKLVLLGGGVVAVAGVAYGAGLLMNHSDVPKGTTVLGVDIGGGTRDDAVKKLDEALSDRVDNPVKLTVDGDTVTLKPDQAGLSFDAQATVREAATSDYNPVSVIGSLFGEQRVVEPVMPVDEEKLHSALEDAAGGAGSATDGTIKFVSGKAVPVYGKPGKGIDVDNATDAVAKAYRTQVETGTGEAVALPTTTRQPTVSDAEVDRMMKEFAQPAMSGRVTVQTDPAHAIPLSPENSLWKFLRVQAVDGKLVENPDLNALEELYGSTFDGVLITRGTGQKTEVTPQDVYQALRTVLTSKTNRTAVIKTS